MSGPLRFRLPDEPRGGFKECPACEESYASLMDSGLCWDCDEDRARRAGRRRDVVLRASGAPRRIVATPFEEPDRWPRDAGAESGVDEWSGTPPLVTLYGSTESGKSMLAAELLFRHREPGAWVLAADVPDLKIHDRGRFEDLRTCRAAVVVDELGRGHNRDAWEYLYLLIAGRWEDLRPTIVTTNLKVSEILEAHPPLGRRIGQGWCVPLRRRWADR